MYLISYYTIPYIHTHARARVQSLSLRPRGKLERRRDSTHNAADGGAHVIFGDEIPAALATAAVTALSSSSSSSSSSSAAAAAAAAAAAGASSSGDFFSSSAVLSSGGNGGVNMNGNNGGNLANARRLTKKERKRRIKARRSAGRCLRMMRALSHMPVAMLLQVPALRAPAGEYMVYSIWCMVYGV